MARWGLGVVSIGCIVMMFSQTQTTGSLLYCLLGVLVVACGFMLVYKDKKGNHSVEKQDKKR